MHWIYLSPHLDDVALSCGGLAWEQAQRGEQVSVWTLCAGDPPEGEFSAFARSLHERWQTGLRAAAARRLEDLASCAAMGAEPCHLPVPDCIYRRGPDGEALYASESAIFGELHTSETGLLARLASQLRLELPEGANLVCPLGLGGHVDHRLARRAAEALGQPLWYYADYPYVLSNASLLPDAGQYIFQDFPLSLQALRAWVQAVAAHRSQISSFWPDDQAMQAAITSYAGFPPGVRLWAQP